jgi:hypothetical protein
MSRFFEAAGDLFVDPGANEARARELVTRAHRDCFVANSVSTPIEITPTFVFGEASALR